MRRLFCCIRAIKALKTLAQDNVHRAVVGAVQLRLDLGLLYQLHDLGAAGNVVDTRSIVGRSVVFACIPAGKHAGARGIELAARVAEHRRPPLVLVLNERPAKVGDQAAIEQELVQKLGRTHGHVACIELEGFWHGLVALVVPDASRVELVTCDIEVAEQHNVLSHGGQVADACVEGKQKGVAVPRALLVAACGAVYVDQDKERELDKETAPFAVDDLPANGSPTELPVCGVAADLFLGRGVDIPCAGAGDFEDAGDAFLHPQRYAFGVSGVHRHARVPYLR